MTNPFKIGDKVRFIDNELNRAEIPGRWFLPEAILIVNEIYPTGCMQLVKEGIIEWMTKHFSRFELAEPIPQPKFANIKVGQYVEIMYDGEVIGIHKVIDVKEYIRIDNNYAYEKSTGMRVMDKRNKINRIVPPSKVVIDFGELKGTLIKNTNTSFFLLDSNEKVQAIIPFVMLRTAKQSEVKELLDAIDKEP